jgi:hypothetical protein
MQQAFSASAPNFVSATFRAGDVVATLQLQPLAIHTLSGGRPELGLDEDAHLIPMNVMGSGIDALSQLEPAYCAAAARSAVCLGEVNELQMARSALYSDLNAPAGDPPMLSGFYSRPRRDLPSLGRNQDWGTLIEGAAPAAFSRTLTLDAIETVAEPALFERPAYQAIRLRFTLAGYPPFTRDLNEPVRLGDEWLVATAATADGVTFERMSNAQRVRLVNERCPR